MADDMTPAAGPRQRPLSKLATAAIKYAEKGYRVFPLEPRGKTPIDPCDACLTRLPAKEKDTGIKTCRKCGATYPDGTRGVHTASTDLARVESWWRQYPDANIGIATGRGLLVVDIDGEIGAATLARLTDEYGPLPLTPTQKTGKGRHYLFTVEGEVRNTTGRLGAIEDAEGKRLPSGIDTRGDGGYIVGGPSIHPNGEPYTWDADARPSQLAAAPCPAWILGLLAPKISERAAVQPQPAASDADTLTKYASKALDSEFEKVSGSGSGTRNATLNTAAFSLGQLVGAGMLSESLVIATLQNAASNCGLTSDDGPQQVLATINSGLSKGKQNPRVVEMRRTGSPMRGGKAAQAAAPAATAAVASQAATVHALDDARPVTATAWRESVWLEAEPEDWVLNKDGAKLGSSTHNMLLHLRHERLLCGLFALDERSRHTVVTRLAPWGGSSAPNRLLTDADITGLCCLLETRTLRPKFNDANRVIQFAASENIINPVRDRLIGFQWDGTPRLDHWAIDLLGAADTSFVRQASAKWLISAVARILRPGCKVDTMLVLEGAQGKRKSAALAALAGTLGEDTFTDRLSKLDNKDAAIELQGNVIVEIAELDAFSNTRASLIKAFLSRQVDKIRLPWAATVTSLPRSCVFAGTVNPGGAGWMHDVTGGRRFWPIEVGQIDLAGLAEAAPQLWAEAAARYEAGEEWWLTDEVVIAEANRAAMDRTDEDVWASDIDDFIAGKQQVRTEEILGGLQVEKSRRGMNEQKRVANHMHRRGWVRETQRVEGAPKKVWVRHHRPLDD